MKAITLWQPWASLVALGEKKIETRSWATNYRGPIAIHAAKNSNYSPEAWAADDHFTSVLLQSKKPWPQIWDFMPLGKVIAVAELVNCWYIVHHPGTNVDAAKHIEVGAESLTTDKHAPDFADYIVPTEQEILFGDWTPGRYAWQLENVHQLVTPIPAKGMQRLWNWDETPHLVTIDPWKIGPTYIWTPDGIRHGKQVLPGAEDAVSGLEVVA